MINYIGKSLLIENFGEKILAVSDLHIGYEESLRNSGIFVPPGQRREMMEDLEEIFKSVERVDKVVIVGDLRHEFGRILRDEWKGVFELIDYLSGKCKEIIFVKGNHDVITESVLKKRELKVVDYYKWGEFCFLHGDRDFDEIYGREVKCWVVGHGHPAVKLSEGVKVEKYKCFLEGKFKGKKVIILPSFFPIVVGSDPRENDLGIVWKLNYDKFSVKIVSEGLEVLDFGVLGKFDKK